MTLLRGCVRVAARSTPSGVDSKGGQFLTNDAQRYCARAGCSTLIDGSSRGRSRQCARCLRIHGRYRSEVFS